MTAFKAEAERHAADGTLGEWVATQIVLLDEVSAAIRDLAAAFRELDEGREG